MNTITHEAEAYIKKNCHTSFDVEFYRNKTARLAPEEQLKSLTGESDRQFGIRLTECFDKFIAIAEEKPKQKWWERALNYLSEF
jgi:hypothetical protein